MTLGLLFVDPQSFLDIFDDQKESHEELVLCQTRM